MAENLVVVESPAKAKTINKYLGRAYVVKASLGHVKDLPKSKLGVDIEHGFEPQYVAVKAKAKVLKDLKAEAKKAKKVYIATDPDREGEAIGWHLAGELKTKANTVVRVRFHEITKGAILKAVAEPMALDMALVNAQQARRVLDRLVGYSLSPLLWKSIRRGLSAGRVQSIGVRLVVEREDEINAFKAEEYWDLNVDLQAAAGRFTAQLFSLGGEKTERLSPAEAQALATELKALRYSVAALQKKEKRQFPGAPYTTSTLQQDAARKLRFSAKRTMSVAQQLYEGLELGAEGSTGLITYMRTDSVRVSAEAQEEARQLIKRRWPDALPDKPPFYKSKRQGQDAHEAVRPTSALREPSAIAKYLSPDQNKLYGLIWRRFIASQMAYALFDATTVDVLAPRPKPAAGTRKGDAIFRATGSVLKAAGFLAVYGVEVQVKPDAHEDEDEKQERDEREEKRLPAIKEGEALDYLDSLAAQHFTQPPPRYSDATLVKALEELGIGRPSTYVSIINTILDRLYVERIEGGRLKPTELGVMVNALLVERFKGVLNVDFTAQMEAKLDDVEAGKLGWQDAVASFYGPFALELEAAKLALKDSKKKLETVSAIPCDLCGEMLVVKWGKMGKFLACPRYPECKGTKPLLKTADGSIKAGKVITVDQACDKCGLPMLVKTGRFGRFVACSGYPKCKNTKPLNDGTGMSCPQCGEGQTLKRRGKRGRSFYACDKYPACDFTAPGKPIAKSCPDCNARYLVEKKLKSGITWACATAGCGHKEMPSELLADLKGV